MSEPYNPPAAPPPSGPPAYGAPGLPWDREKNGNALIETAKGLVTAPGDAFARMREKGDYLSPILFAVIFGTLGTVVYQIWQLVFGAAFSAWAIGFLPPEMRTQMAAAFEPSVGAVIFSLVLAPVFAVIGVFLGGGIYHLFLLLLGGTKESTAGFEGTLRTVSYASIANLAHLVPIGGIVIAMVWSLVLNVIGLSRVHHTSTGKALLAVLLPWVLCCACIVVGVLTMGAAIGAAVGAANQ